MLTIKDYLDSHLNSAENNTLLFIFKDFAYGFHMDWILEGKEVNVDGNVETIYPNLHISERYLSFNILKNIYYKIDNKWIDVMKLPKAHNIRELAGVVEQYKNLPEYEVNRKYIPYFIYTDVKGNLIHVNAMDGLKVDRIPMVDLTNPGRFNYQFEFINIDNPGNNLKPHLCDDLKIDIYDKNNEQIDLKNILVWYNGFFYPFFRKYIEHEGEIIYNEPNTIYLRDVKKYTPSKYIRDKLGAIPNSVRSKTGKFDTVSLENDYENNEYAYDINIRIFSWDNVDIDGWYSVINSHNYTIYDEFALNEEQSLKYSADYKKEITFGVEIKDTHFLMRNGVIIDPSEYELKSNKRTVVLTKIEKEIEMLKRELKSMFGKEYIFHLNKYLYNFDYKLINFTYSGDDKSDYTIDIIRNRNMIINHPYPMHVIIPDLQIYDIPMVDGTYERYEIKGDNVIAFPYTEQTPSMKNLVTGQSVAANRLDDCDIYTLYFTKVNK